MSASVKDEIDQTPRWWISLYHSALAASGAETVEGETWEWHTWAGNAAYTWTERGYVDCACHDCRRICA